MFLQSRKSMVTITLLLITLLVSITTAGYATEPQYGYILPEDLTMMVDLMDKPDETATVLFSYYRDVRVELLSEDPQTGWANVRICNIDGYMRTEYLSFDVELADVPHLLPVAVIKGIKSDSGDVNFRELPTFDVPPLTYCFVGEKLHVLGISEQWCHVNSGGRMGFMRAEYVKETGDITDYIIGPFQSPIRDQGQE